MLFNRVNNWLTDNKAIAGLLLFLLCLTFFSWLEYAPTLSDPDSFYHIKVSQLIGEQGLVKDFPYLQFTTLKDGYIDHHLLYHLYLAPFVKFFPPLVGAKLGHILLDSLALLTLYFLLVKLKVRGPFWYIVFLFFVEPFVFRLGLVKAQPLSLIILFLGVYLITHRKYYLLTLLSFVYVWSYGGWFLIFIITALYVFIESLNLAFSKNHDNWLSQVINFKVKKTDFLGKVARLSINFIKSSFRIDNIKLLASVLIGLVLGLVINPYFPKNLEFYYVHIIKIAFVNYQSVIGVGSEWYPYRVSDFFINSSLPFSIGFLALIIFLNYHRKFTVTVKYALALFLVFILATLKSRRNIEYLAPFAVIFSALTFSQAWSISEIKNDFKEFKKVIKKVFLNDVYVKIALTVFSVLVIATLFYQMPYQAKKSLDNGFNFNYLKSASQYLIANSQPGDIVFHSDWDEFPMLFYHNSQNYYLVGLDPTFMYLFDQDLYHKWADVTQGKRYKEIYDIIKNDFKAKYIIATTDHRDMIRNLDNNFYFDKVYSDSEAIIYKIF
ncbi:MAG: hypothetical protein Q7K65_04220 [Candidatus Buchananbacteria bacterium]|nr:hypothetical protein [Candidatus Buchananbacteria bacterium]